MTTDDACKACGHARVFHQIGKGTGVPAGRPYCDDRHSSPCSCDGFVENVELTQYNAYDATIREALRHPMSTEHRRQALAAISATVELFGLAIAIPPVPMVLTCPCCNARHIDEGEFATKPHHTHACQQCGMVWRPAITPTVGVQFLPGFKNTTTVAPTPMTKASTL